MTAVTYFRVAGNPNALADEHVHRVCIHCEDEVFFLMTKDQFRRWQIDKEYVQDVFEHVCPEVREWMISGTHPHCWNEVFGED